MVQAVGTTGTAAASPPDIARTLVTASRQDGRLNAGALAESVAGQPPALRAAVEAQLTPVERGQLAAALDGPLPRAVTMPDGTRVGVTTSSADGRTLEHYRDSADPADRAVHRAAINSYGSIDAANRALAAQAALPPAQASAARPAAISVASPPPPPSSPEGVGSFVDGAIRGDYGDNSSWSATAGQVAMGFVPIVGQVADARDTAAAIGQVRNGQPGGWVSLGAAAIGWIPGVGDAAKAAIRGGDRLAGAGGEIAQGAIRQGDEAAAAVARGRVEIDGGRPGEWPGELNARELRANTDYHVNGYRFATDAQGRVTSVEGRLDLEAAARNGYQQRIAGGTDRLPGDQGGHLIASIFKGPGDRINLVAMDGNFNMGAWRSMEARLETALKEGKTVDVKIDVRYSDGQRPTSFRVEYTIDGQVGRETFRNQPGG